MQHRSYGISYELKNLMPETYYWAGFSYRDPGCETIHSRIINFKTEPIEKRWEQAFNFPSYGLRIGYTHNTLDSVVYESHEGNYYGPIGECFTIAGFMNGPIYRGKKWSFDYDIIYGADFWTRHGNEMLGSALNFHVSFDIGPTIRLTDNLDLAARYMYVHSSNGATFLPDNGVNSHLLRVALRYHPNHNTLAGGFHTLSHGLHQSLIVTAVYQRKF